MRSLFVPLLAALLWSGVAEASEPLTWRDEWPRFRTSEGVAAGLFTGAFVANTLWLEQNEHGPSGGVLFDDAVVDALTLDDRRSRENVVLAGDLTFYSMFAYPLVDAGLAWGVRGSGEVAAQMLLIDWQSFALSGAIATASQKGVGRRRPYVDDCATDPDYDPACGNATDSNQSFVSGHTLAAFTGAGLTCVHHQHLDLYGAVGDPLACAAALTAATWVGTSRITTKNHYASDVLSGALLGLGSGYLLPSVLHYGFGSEAPTDMASVLIMPFSDGTHVGLGVAGVI
ncbi:MAG: phosphatase PAP2 family protein [Polyangiaceae bacterium]